MRARLLEILGIARGTSNEGAGLSLREAMTRARYGEVRATLGAADLLPLLEADPGLTSDWLLYAENKRTSAGWYLLLAAEIGREGDDGSRRRFASLEQAVAEYVVLELNYWADRRAGCRHEGQPR